MPDSPPCTICGGVRYVLGPNGRRSRRRLAPRCAHCGSLERHRRLRSLYRRLPGAYLSGLRVLQLSPDIGVDPAWFADYEVSQYGGDNSLDLECISREDGVYDLVICNHVLEHVADDRRGYRELLRITHPQGVVQITVPSPYTRGVTEDWGYPRAESHGHYRGYGRDIIDMFRSADPQARVLEVAVDDPVTGDGDYIYFSTRDAERAEQLRAWLLDTHLTTPTEF